MKPDAAVNQATTGMIFLIQRRIRVGQA